MVPFRLILIGGDAESLNSLLDRAGELAPRNVGLMLRDPEHRPEVVADLVGSIDPERIPANVVPIVNGLPATSRVPQGWWRHIPSDAITESSNLEEPFGASVHSEAEIGQGEEAGARYLCLGPVFPTPSKPGHPGIGVEQFGRLCASTTLPVFALGGIATEGDLDAVLRAGAFGFACISCGTPAVNQRLNGMLARLDEFLIGREE